MTNNEAIGLLAKHLAKVKLEAAESKDAADKFIAKLKLDLQVALKQIEMNKMDIEGYQKQIEELQKQNTYKVSCFV